MYSKRVMLASVLAFAMGLGIGFDSALAQEELVMTEVMPRVGEVVVRDEVFVLADASGTMRADAKFRREHNLVKAFVDGMPRGGYGAGLSTFGNTDKRAWLRHSMDPFVRVSLAMSATNMEILGGLTPLETAMLMLPDEYDLFTDRAALVVFSDGKADPEPVLEATRAIIERHQGELCIFTVLHGDDEKGRQLLAEMAKLGDCGASYTADDINSKSGMENFIREVFFDMEPDSDGDGVPDSRDECPGTPRGVKVDEVGCPLDTDGDGVPDYLDECPGTPKGARVDDRGCWVLRDLNFDTDKWDIKPEFEGLLNEVARVLNNNSGVHVRVDGHTDSRASDAHNQTLSQNRASSVRDALVTRGIAASRLDAKGFGEGSPIRPNDTAANMYLNRRVELTVIK